MTTALIMYLLVALSHHKRKPYCWITTCSQF
jgi:hypothetical protein